MTSLYLARLLGEFSSVPADWTQVSVLVLPDSSVRRDFPSTLLVEEHRGYFEHFLLSAIFLSLQAVKRVPLQTAPSRTNSDSVSLSGHII